MNARLTQKAKEIIRNINYITVATASKTGQPWNSPVSAYVDKDYNFYWASWTENQHSKNIRENQNVFIVIYDSTALEGTGEGVYIKAKAYEITDEQERVEALSHRGLTKSGEEKEYSGDYPRRLYKAVPEQVWINGDGEIDGNFIDIRTEIDLLAK